MLARKLNNTGDTIVEVLISVALVGVVLAGAYAAVISSLNASQQSLERSQAIKLLETQLERLKSLASTNYGLINGTNPSFCINGSMGKSDLSVVSINGVGLYADVLDSPPAGYYHPDCVLDSSSNIHSSTSRSIAYFVSIERTGTDNYTAMARWHRTGGGREEAKIVYRVHP